MSENEKLFMECYDEVHRQFPGSTPYVLKNLADRLYASMTNVDVCRMKCDEVYQRCVELRTALGTLPDHMRGLKPGDKRPKNAKDES